MNKYPNLKVKFKGMDHWVTNPLSFTPLLDNRGILALTGHRPDKMGDDYSLTSSLWMYIKERLQEYINRFRPYYMISGMALGADTLWAKLAIENKIPLIAAIPFDTQDAAWPNRARSLYHSILGKATMVVNITGQSGYMSAHMQLRNEWMVDHCSKLIAVWDGSAGGTANCIKYARNVKVPSDIYQINPFFEHQGDSIVSFL